MTGSAARLRTAAATLVVLASCRSAPVEETSPSARQSAGPTTTVARRPTGSALAAASTRSRAPTRAAPDAGGASACLDIERREPATGRCGPNCPQGEVYVPATGRDGFTMGASLQGDADRPHRVVLTQPFCMDATEVTAKAYGECLDAGRCEPPRWWGEWTTYPALPDHPVNKVHWHHAKTYCAYRDKSLPTEAQWEWAATGGDGRRWPWGNDPPTCERADFTPGVLGRPAPDAGCHGGGTSAVGSHPAGAKIWPDGAIHDLAGNVWEWCRDNYAPYSGEPEVDPTHLTAELAVHVVRGGGWNRSGRGIRAQYRGGAVYDYQVPGLGFRCVRNPKPAGQ